MRQDSASTKTSPFFSVLMSSYNNESTVSDSIKSVLDQIFKDFELILINDGSTDNTGTIMQSFSDNNRNISYHSNNQNIGKSLSFNLGALLARGKYLAIADADDIWLPEKLHKQFCFLVDNAEIDVLGGQLFRFGDWGISGYPTNLPLANNEIRKIFSRSRMAVNNPTVVIRKEVFLSIGGYRGYFRRNEDLDFFIRLNSCDINFANLPDVLLYYRTQSQIQPIKYWIIAEYGRQKILLENTNVFSKLFPVLILTKIILDYCKLFFSYIFLRIKDFRV